MASSFSLANLASIVDAELWGDGGLEVDGLASLEAATETQLSFITKDRHLDALAKTKALCVVISSELAANFTGNRLVVANPYLAYATLSKVFDIREKSSQGVHPSAVVDETAEIHPTVSIGANCVVEAGVSIGEGTELLAGCVIGKGSSLGADCLLHANVTIYHGVKIGCSVVIHSGTVIGSDGFGFAPHENEWVKIYQLGGVVIGNQVEIGASTAIDRGALDDTIIEDKVIIDNLVHIAHNVKVGFGSAIAGCVGIAGSTVIGKHCTVAGAVAINGHIQIADNTHFHGGTIVTKGNCEGGTFASTPPLQNVEDWRRNSARYRKLDQLAGRVKSIEKQLGNKPR